jgi:hypothetical protein
MNGKGSSTLPCGRAGSDTTQWCRRQTREAMLAGRAGCWHDHMTISARAFWMRHATVRTVHVLYMVAERGGHC